MPRHTGQVWVLGGAPNWVEQPQKILVAVLSWACTSSPMTGSNVVMGSLILFFNQLDKSLIKVQSTEGTAVTEAVG